MTFIQITLVGLLLLLIIERARAQAMVVYPPAISVDKLLKCLRQLEGYHGLPGQNGELGEFQLLPVNCVLNQGGSEKEARLFLSHLMREIQAFEGRPAMVSEIGQCWNGGLGRFKQNRVSAQAYDYGLRLMQSYYGN